MKIRILIVISLSLLLAECARNSISSEDVYQIDILKGYSKVNDFNLSDIANEVHYVKLENHPDAIFSVGVPIINDSFILIKGFLENRLILFGSDGKFICNIGRSGQGPGEFLNLQDVYLHPHEPKILVHDGTSSKILVFFTGGECLQEFNYSNLYKDPLEKVCYTKEGEILVVLRRPFSKVEEYALVRTLNNEFIETKLYHKIANEFNASGGTTGFSNYWINDGQLYLHEFFYDRVFTQKNDDFTPIFQFSFTNNHAPAYYVPRDPGVWNYNSIPFVTGVGKYLLMYANLPDIEKGYILLIFDGESKQLFRPRKPKTKNYNQKSLEGINNDVDGFGQVVITESNNGKVADILNIIDLQQTIIEKDFLINVTHPQEQRRLIELVERMKPEDNPIVRIFTLR